MKISEQYKKNILVIGSLNMDIVINVKQLPKPGETVTALDKQEYPGGKGANQAFAAAKLGGNTAMIGRVGTDAYGEALISNLKKAGANIEGIIAGDEADTGIAFIEVEESGENTIAVVSDANAKLSPQDLDAKKELIDNADIMLLQLEIPFETVRHAIELCAGKGKIVVLNPAPVNRHITDDIYNKISILTPNEVELGELTGMKTDTLENIGRAAGSLAQKGAGAVIVTLGEKGAMLVRKGEEKHFPAIKVKAVDTTAAGDSFSAAVCVALSEGKSIEDAIVFANMIASIVVTRKGAQPSVPSRAEVDQAILTGNCFIR